MKSFSLRQVTMGAFQMNGNTTDQVDLRRAMYFRGEGLDTSYRFAYILKPKPCRNTIRSHIETVVRACPVSPFWAQDLPRG